MSRSSFPTMPVSATFKVAAENKKPDRRKRTPPVSIRFSEDERDLLREYAGNERLSTYVRHYVVKGHDGKPKRKSSPSADFQETARVLSALGRSELATLLRDTLSAYEAGQLRLEPETETAIRRACADITAMRSALVKALGLRSDVAP